MARKKPGDIPPDHLDAYRQSRADQFSMERTYAVISPLFGGGTVANEPDMDMPIRASSIRGHLRFWWRATAGGRFGNDLNALRKAEAKIWGSTSKPSAVDIAVLNFSYPKKGKLLKIDPYAYGAFPLRGPGDDLDKPLLKMNRFTLRICGLVDDLQDLQNTFWAWEVFGGIGARTRRGFGSLHCIGIKNHAQIDPDNWSWSYSIEDVEKRLQNELVRRIPVFDFHPDLHHLSPQTSLKVVQFRQQEESGFDVLQTLLERFKKYRQDRPVHNRKPGRSRWPEPDAIRRLAQQNRPNIRLNHQNPNHTLDKFPRAEFGLPINFEMKDEPDIHNATLRGTDEQQQRLQSALIIKPLACANDKFVGLAVILDGPRLPSGGITFEFENGSSHAPIESKLSADEAQTLNTNQNQYGGNTDILLDFLNYL